LSDETVPVLVAGARTPFGRFRGGLASLRAPELGAAAIRGALERAGITAEDVDQVILGQVVQAGAGQGPARQASVGAGIGWDVPTSTVNKICLSGLSAITDAARLIRLGEARVVVAGGQESMTAAPHLLHGVRSGLGFGDTPLIDSLSDALTDAWSGQSMGADTEAPLVRLGISRSEQDEVAARSHQRAEEARAKGLLAQEISPVTVDGRKGAATLVDDEGIRAGTTVEVLARLRPAFAPDGTITAGSSSPLSDGAAAVVVTSLAWAREHDLVPLARIGASGQVAGPDATLHSQPSRAIAAALRRAHLDLSDLDVLEVNEAFAAVLIQSARDLGLPTEDFNREGGSIALGHPVGASGTRLALHVALALHRRGGGTGVAALCGGGGQGEALILHAFDES
jgi:acetyl-CoA C-acetyltransferase